MINLELATACNEHTELRREVEIHKAKCKAIRKERQREIITNIAMAIIIIATIVIVCTNATKTEPRYAIASERQTNGNYFVYVTEHICEVTKTTVDMVTVSYKGNEYSFYGCGYEVGEEIVCQFTDNMEVVGVVE